MALKKFSTQIKDFGGTICPTYSDPLDPRIIVEHESDLWETAEETFGKTSSYVDGSINKSFCKVYQGMLVYVEDTKTTYEYVGPIVEEYGVATEDVNHKGNWRAVNTPDTDSNVVITTLVADDNTEATAESFAHQQNNDEPISKDKNKLYILSRDKHTKKEGSRYDYSHDGWIETTTEDSEDKTSHNTLIIRHSDVLRTDTLDAIQKDIDVELKFPYIDEIETDEKGHIIGVNTKTVSLDPANNYAYKFINVDDTHPVKRSDAPAVEKTYNGLDPIEKSVKEAIVDTQSVKTDLTADSETDTLTFKDDRWIHISADNTDDSITISHEDVLRKDESVSLHKSVDEKLTFNMIDEVVTDAKGHVTGVRTNTFDWDPADNYAFKTITVNDTHPSNRTDAKPQVKTYDGTAPIEKSIPEAVVPTSTVTTSLVADSETDTLLFSDDRWIHVGAIPSTDTISIQHEDVERKDEKVSQTKVVDQLVKFDMIDEVVSDAKGHITGIRTNTFTLNPADNFAFKTIKVVDNHPTSRTDSDPAVNTYNGLEPIAKSLVDSIVPTEVINTQVVADSETDTLVFSDDRWIHIDATENSDLITIKHESVERKDAKVVQNKKEDEKFTFDVVDEIKTDAAGHITGVRTNTLTLDPAKNYAFKTIQAITSDVQLRTDAGQDASTKNMLDAVNTTSDSTTTLVADSEVDTLTFKDDKYIHIEADSTSDTLTFSHENVERKDGTTTQTKSIDNDLSVKIVDQVITDAKGHVTGVRTNTLSIPANTNFGYKTLQVGGSPVVTNNNKDYVSNGSTVASSEADTLNINGDTWLDVTISNDQLNLSHGVSSARYNVESNNKKTDDTYTYAASEKPTIYTSGVVNPADAADKNNTKVITSLTTDDANHLISSTYRTDFPTKVWVQWEIENALKSTDAMVFKGGFDPTADSLPTSADGKVQAGYTYKITLNGTITLGSEVRTVVVGDTLICTKDNPSSSDWMVLETRNDLATTEVPGNVIVGDGIIVDTSGEISLDVINYGSSTNPVYINNDKQIVSSTSTVGSGIMPMYLNNGTMTASSETVGSGVKPMYLNNGTMTASSETVGSSIKPMYLNNGTLTASSETIGSDIIPMYLQDGTLTASKTTVGSGVKPMYMNEGTLTASTSTVGSGVKPTYLSEGTITLSTSTVGSTAKPLYMDKGELKECNYELNSKIDSGSKDTLAYYSGNNEINSFTDTVGSGTKGWYLNNGIPTESTSNVGSGTTPMYLNNGTLTLSTSSVGSGTTPMYMDGGTLTASTSSVGGNLNPMYMNNGTLTASNASVGSGVTPIYISDGTLTASGSTVGSNAANAGTPIYMNAGSLTAVTNINSGLLSNLGGGLNISDGKLSFNISDTGAISTITGCDEINASKSGNTVTLSVNDASIGTAKITNSAITTAKIADSNVTTAKLANSAVTTDKIADSAVTKAKLGSDVFDDLDASVSNTTPTNLTVSVVESNGILTTLTVNETNAESKRTASTTSPSFSVTNATGIALGSDLTNLKGYVDDLNTIVGNKISTTDSNLSTLETTVSNDKTELQGNIDAVEAKIPTVNNSTIKLINNSVDNTLGSFTLNQSTDTTINLGLKSETVNDNNPNVLTTKLFVGNLASNDPKREPVLTCTNTLNTAGVANSTSKLYLIGTTLDPLSNTVGETNAKYNVYADTDSKLHAVSYYATSDIRKKNILNDVNLTTELIANLPAFDFEWKDGGGKSTGTSAQAVKEILPNLVSGDETLNLDYGSLGVVSSIVLARKIVELENKIIELENKLNNDGKLL